MQFDLLKNYLISAIRTFVPMAVGLVTGWLAARGITLDNNVLNILTLVLEGAAGIAYYLIVRGLEHVHYRFGWLLGYAKMPVYTVSPTVAPLPGASTMDPATIQTDSSPSE